MRRGFLRLAQMVEEEFGRSAVDGGLYVFFSRRRDRVKLLWWDEDGYSLLYKWLEAGTFRVEEKEGSEEITAVDLDLLLKGMSLHRIRVRKKKLNLGFSVSV
jgi:transposase